MRRLLSSLRGGFGMPRTAVVGPHPFATSIRPAPVLWLILCGGLLVTAIILGTAVMVGEFRERALSNSERELENTVLLLTRHFDQQFEDSNFIVNNLISQMQISGIASPELFRSQMSTPDAHLMLQSKASVLSYIGDVMIFDAQGELINSSGPWPLPTVNVADRTYFKALKSNPQSAAVLAEPVRSYFTGSWTTILAHRLSGPNGVFLGVLARRIDPVKFEKFFASVALGNGAAISMFHRDGTLLARHPHTDSMIGQTFKTALLISEVPTAGVYPLLRHHASLIIPDRLGHAT